MAELVCSVYYDNFATTVKKISSNNHMFSKKCFLREFEDNLMFGFLFGFITCDREMDIQDDPSLVMSEYRDMVRELVREVRMVKRKLKCNQ